MSLLADQADWIDALAVWELDRGSADTPSTIRRLVEGLILSNREAEDLAAVFEIRNSILDRWTALAIAARKRLAGRPQFRRALDIVIMDREDLARSVESDFLGFEREGLSPAPLIGGDDLLEAGLKAGPRFKTILDATYDAQLEGRVLDRASALAYALQLEHRS